MMETRLKVIDMKDARDEYLIGILLTLVTSIEIVVWTLVFPITLSLQASPLQVPVLFGSGVLASFFILHGIYRFMKATIRLVFILRHDESARMKGGTPSTVPDRASLGGEQGHSKQ